MADTRGVFSLKVARSFKSKGLWTSLDNVWHSPSPAATSDTGYFGGDSFPAPDRYRTSVDKLSYSTETAAEVPGAAGSVNRFKLGAASARANGLSQPPTPTPTPSTTGGVPNII